MATEGWLAVMLAAVGLTACAGASQAEAEAACQEKGYTPGTMAFAECLHPRDAEDLERAREAWERDAEGIGR